jgi:branched-chain amino acid transport system permease protein
MSRLVQIAIAAVPVGSVYALAASGLVLTYRTSRVFNFAHGAVGMFCAFLFYQAWQVWKLPLPLAFILVVVGFAPAMALLLERMVFRQLRESATSVKVVVTVGLLIALQGGASAIWGSSSLFLPAVFPEGSFRVFGDVRMGYDQLSIIAVSVGTMLLLGALIRFTRFGLWVRASVDRPDLAELVGVNTALVSAVSWAVGFATAAVAGILLTPTLGLDSFTLTLFVIQAFAAALLGRLESFPLAFAGGLLIAFLEQLSSAYLPTSGAFLAVRPAVPFALIFGLLAYAALVPGSRLGRWVRVGTGEPSAPRPTAAPVQWRHGRRWGLALVGALALAAPLLASEWLRRAELGLTMAGVFASLVVLSGLSGQISLMHTAFVGTGAFAMAFLTAHAGLPFPLALFLSALAAVPMAVFVALPAIRLHGLHVALLTFGFGLVVAELFQSGITGGTAGATATRPAAFHSDLAFFYVLLAVAALLVLVAANVQRSPTGRVLAAIRDSEPAARSIGVRLPLYRLAVFSLSGFMAAAAGGLLASFQGIVTFNDFHPIYSLVWLSVVVIGGLGSVTGAVVAAALWGFGSTSVGALPQVAFGLGAMFLARNERGLIGVLGELRKHSSAAGNALRRAALAHDGLAWPNARAGLGLGSIREEERATARGA